MRTHEARRPRPQCRQNEPFLAENPKDCRRFVTFKKPSKGRRCCSIRQSSVVSINLPLTLVEISNAAQSLACNMGAKVATIRERGREKNPKTRVGPIRARIKGGVAVARMCGIGSVHFLIIRPVGRPSPDFNNLVTHINLI